MQLSVKGRHVDVGDAFREHVDSSLSAVLEKYFSNAMEANVTLSRQHHRYRVVISAHIGRGIQLESHGDAEAPYPAFDLAVERLSTRLRRQKRRLRDHHNRASEEEILPQSSPAQQYIIAADDDETAAAEGDTPIVVAEMTTEIPSLTVSEAVMRMDLAGLPALLFRNRAHGGLNMVYSRNDGNIGWIDPQGNSGS